MLLFLAAREEGYAREIAKMWDMDVSTVQSQLKRMERDGLLVNQLAGRTRIYKFNPRYTFLDETRKLLAKAMATIGFITDGLSPRYFIHTDCQWSVEFPTAPLAIGHEHIQNEQVAALETDAGTIRLLSPTDSIKDRLLWWYLEQDPQCWEQSLDVARNHKVNWADLKKWHAGEGYADEFAAFKQAV